MANSSFWDHPIDKLEAALDLKKQIHSLETKLRNLFSSSEEVSPAVATGPAAGGKKRGGKRFFSAETKAKMAAAQKARWLKKNGGMSAEVSSPAEKSAVPAKRKSGLSPEGRARIAAAQKARHAAKKKST